MGCERRFDGQTVLITGAASGFGALAAQQFSAEGAKLALCDIQSDALDDVANNLRDCDVDVETANVDVSCEADMSAFIDRILARFSRLDIAINNAGIGQKMTPITDMAIDDYDRIMAVNARSVFLGMKYQLPPMLQARQGVILNVASAAGLVGAGMLAAYAASKHAVVGMTRAAADEVARKNVRVNALCPSFAVTPLFNDIADQMAARRGENRMQAYDRMSARVPMRRVAKPEEVVQAMLWICAPENSFMTGQAVSIDGGLTAV
jgi:NAD(P)-dependent dehydrogenase (short-subunit alcohol dehydrogenase family)